MKTDEFIVRSENTITSLISMPSDTIVVVFYQIFSNGSLSVFEGQGINHLFLVFFVSLSFLVVFLLYGVSLIFGITISDSDSDKLSNYECGFVPFGDSRIPFDINFYIVSLLFVIFDLELVFLFPWSFILTTISYFGFFNMFIFFFILLVGFIYEWLSGSLDI